VTCYPALTSEKNLKKLSLTALHMPLAVCLPLAAALAACVPAPKRAYSAEETSKLDDITEVMRVNAATMDPLFSYEEPTKFDDKSFATLPAAAAQMKATGTALQDARIAHGFAKGFVDHAKDLAAGGDKLRVAAEKKDRAAASAAIREIHQTCRDCHSEFR